MKKSNQHRVGWFILFACLFLLPGCQVIGDIFKTGVWFGVIGVVVVVGVVIWLISKAGGGGSK
jgi:cytosine/uracil/thiamine/allantoin permease